MSTKISVVLCTYNGSAYLEPLLLSLARQSEPIDELIVADDNSTDDSRLLIDKYGSQVASRVVWQLREVNLGPRENFSRGLAVATGDVVALCDQDDIWATSKISSILEFFRREASIGIVQHDGTVIDQKGARIAGSLYERLSVGASVGVELFQRLLRRNLSPGCTLAARRELLETALPVPPGFMHDEWLALFGAAFGTLRQIPDRLIAYRLHEGNALGLRGIGTAAVVASVGSDARAARAAKIARLEVFKARLMALTESPLPECMALLEETLAHLRTRQHLPGRRLARIAPVFAEWRSGRYHRHGSGAISAMRDLLGL